MPYPVRQLNWKQQTYGIVKRDKGTFIKDHLADIMQQQHEDESGTKYVRKLIASGADGPICVYYFYPPMKKRNK